MGQGSLLMREEKRIRCNTARLQGLFMADMRSVTWLQHSTSMHRYHMTTTLLIASLSQLKLYLYLSAPWLLLMLMSTSSYNDFVICKIDSHD